jgi:ectoine hydroxylase-related dioxygenase (phytanoyl-CoA dioxygenase family)
VAQDSPLLIARLLSDGYCIARGIAEPAVLAELNRDFAPRFAETPYCQGGFYGERTKRFGALLRRSSAVQALVRHSLVLGIADAVLSPGCERIVLNLTQAVELHPGALAQVPHRDETLYGDPRGEIEYLINVIWPLTPFTRDNGATMIWPGSHGNASHGANGGNEAGSGPAVCAEMAPGDALIWLGSTLHSAGANTTSQDHRRGVIVSYCLGWLRTFENQYLIYPPEVARSFDPELASLVGYAQHLPNLGNVEGQCPSILLSDDNIDHLPAIDALGPNQAEKMRAYLAEQAAARAGLMGG